MHEQGLPIIRFAPIDCQGEVGQADQNGRLRSAFQIAGIDECKRNVGQALAGDLRLDCCGTCQQPVFPANRRHPEAVPDGLDFLIRTEQCNQVAIRGQQHPILLLLFPGEVDPLVFSLIQHQEVKVGLVVLALAGVPVDDLLRRIGCDVGKGRRAFARADVDQETEA